MSRFIRRARFARRGSMFGAAAILVLIAVACAQLQPSVSLPISKPAAAPTSAAVGAPAQGVAAARAPAASSTGGQAQPQPASISADSAASSPAPSNASAQPQTSVPPLDRMVIRTGHVTVEIQGEMEHAIAAVRQIAQRGGGFVSGSNTHHERVDNQDRTVADLTLQVRSDSTDETVSALRALGNAIDETSTSQDVTEEYVDVDSNLRNLQASESAILKLMDKATRIEDVLSLQRELTNVRGQIERLQGRKNYLQNRSDMATITVSLRMPAPANAQPTSGTGWNPLDAAQQGWQASLSLLRGVAQVVIVVTAFSWWLVPFLVLGGYVWQRRRRAAGNATAAAQ